MTRAEIFHREQKSHREMFTIHTKKNLNPTVSTIRLRYKNFLAQEFLCVLCQSKIIKIEQLNYCAHLVITNSPISVLQEHRCKKGSIFPVCQLREVLQESADLL